MLPAVVWGLYWLTYPFAGRDRRLIKANIELVYGLPKHSEFSRTFVRQNQKTQAAIMLETIRYVFRPESLLLNGVEEAKKKLNLAAKDSGIVIITAHHGAWELAGHAATSGFDRPFFVLAKPSKAKWLTTMLDQLREKLGMKVLWTDSKSLLRDMMAVAQRREHLGFVMDQRPASKQGGHSCEFLGVKNTQIVSGPVVMTVKKNMPVYSVYMMRTGSGRYQFYCDEVIPKDHNLTDEARVAQLMADSMTAMIRRYPEQWTWNYRRWKS
jgi:KDO2-lipid IV(A) lauroyltransferase